MGNMLFKSGNMTYVKTPIVENSGGDLEKCAEARVSRSGSDHLLRVVLVCLALAVLLLLIAMQYDLQQRTRQAEQELITIKNLLKKYGDEEWMSGEEDRLGGKTTTAPSADDRLGGKKTSAPAADISQYFKTAANRSSKVILSRERRNSRRHRGKKHKTKKSRKANKKQKDRINSGSLLQGHAYHLQSQAITNFDGSKYVDWEPSVQEFGTGVTNTFGYQNGEVTIKRTGVYFVYSQITFRTQFPVVCYSVNRKRSNAITVLYKCMNSVGIAAGQGSAGQRFESCYAGRAVKLQRNDKVYITDEHGLQNRQETRVVNFQPDVTYWGIYMLSDSQS